MTYGDVIRNAREERNWTREQLASAVGASVHAVTSWEINRAMPRPEQREAIERELGLERGSIWRASQKENIVAEPSASHESEAA